MRELVDRARADRVLDAIGRAADAETRVYVLGGTTAAIDPSTFRRAVDSALGDA